MDTISEDIILDLLKKYPGTGEKSINVNELLGNLRDFVEKSPKKPSKEEVLGDVPGVAYSKVMQTLANTSRLLNQKGSPMDPDVKDAIKPEKQMTIAFVSSPVITPGTIARRIITEAIDSKERGFSVDLKSLICDKVHSKFLMNRDGSVCTVEILYPNANGKITVKMSCDGSDDVIQEIATEDEQYTNGLGNYILTILDEMITNARNSSEEEEAVRTEYTIQNPVHLGGFPNVWESVLDRDLKTVNAILEADDDDDSGDDGADMNAEPVSGDDVAASFGGEGGGGFGDAFGGMDPSSGGANNVAAMNQDENMPGMEVTPDKELVKFMDAAMNFKHEAFDTMIRLIANYQSNVQRTSGNGVILTPNEIINGTTPLETQSNNSIVTMFLKIYPELNQELEQGVIDEIERKLWGGADSFPAEFQLIKERLIDKIPDFNMDLAEDKFFTEEPPTEAGMSPLPDENGMGGEQAGGDMDFGGGYSGEETLQPSGESVPGETEEQEQQNESDEEKLDLLTTQQENAIDNL